MPTTSPGRHVGEDDGRVGGLVSAAMLDFNQTIMRFPNMRSVPGGASSDQVPNLQDPANPVPALDPRNLPKIGAQGGRAARGGADLR